MTGTAELVAEDVRDQLSGHEVSLVLAEQASAAQVAAADNLIVVSSTYGDGEVPEPAKPLFSALADGDVGLGNVRFGVIALGDRSLYAQTFAQGGRQWDAMLASKGAVRVVELLAVDSSSGVDTAQETADWLSRWPNASIRGAA